MKNVNIAAKQEVYEAIVVGSGMTGGWAAKELCEKGLKTLVLEFGKNVEHGKGYISEHVPAWAIANYMKKNTRCKASVMPLARRPATFL